MLSGLNFYRAIEKKNLNSGQLFHINIYNNNKIINKNNNFDFVKYAYKGNNNILKNLNNFGQKKYPQEIQQIRDYNKSNFILNNNN